MPKSLDGAGNNPASIKARKRRYLAAYAETGTIKAACTAAQINRSSVTEWRDSDAAFRRLEVQAVEVFADSLEELAYARIQNPDKGRGSDLLLITLLNAHKPDKYRPKTVVHDGHGAALVDSITALVTATKGHRKAVTVIDGASVGDSEVGPRMRSILPDGDGQARRA